MDTCKEVRNAYDAYHEHKRLGELMQCRSVGELNRYVESGDIRNLIRINEAIHERCFSQIADMVCARKAKAVMLSGPSSSGKTTSANRLATQLRAHKKKPILISLDDYYIDRDKIHPCPDGNLDLEHINTIDTELFRVQIENLLSGKAVKPPRFNFKTGKREWNVGESMQLTEDAVLIVEGLHALNPVLLPTGLENELILKLYVCPMLALDLGSNREMSSDMLRLIRRIARDYKTRDSSVQRTLTMWPSVQYGEKRWILPFREKADVEFNSATIYEWAVMKKYVYPLLLSIGPEESCYKQVAELIELLDYVVAADEDDEIPPTSIVREFIGGNTFYV